MKKDRDRGRATGNPRTDRSVPRCRLRRCSNSRSRSDDVVDANRQYNILYNQAAS